MLIGITIIGVIGIYTIIIGIIFIIALLFKVSIGFHHIILFPVDRFRLPPLAQMFPVVTGKFWRYQGGLTTPTCDEQVVWTVFTDAVAITKSQVSVLRFCDLQSSSSNLLTIHFQLLRNSSENTDRFKSLYCPTQLFCKLRLLQSSCQPLFHT